MVCIPCILAPVLLWVWYRFIQPIVLTFWNPWAPKAAVEDGNQTAKEGDGSSKEGKCPFSAGDDCKEVANGSKTEPSATEQEDTVADKKND